MKYILLGIFSLWCGISHAQNNIITVSGYVLDKSDRSTIPGATIFSGTPRKGLGATDNKGFFRVQVPANAVLVFSFLGYNEQSVSVNGRTSLEVVMDMKQNEMKDAVVIGYVKRSRETSTGSSVNISGKDLQDVPVGNITELLQGRVAGMNIQNTSGMPGGRGSIFVRGLSNIAISGGGNDAFLTPTSPLFVIDGVPMDPNSNFEYGFDQAGPGMSPLSLIPPEDVESVDVLKDAMATALYGSQGAFGVIIITTKRGNSKTPIIQYTTNSFFNVPPQLKSVIGGRLEGDIRRDQVYANDSTIYTGRDKIDNSPFLSDYLNPYYNNSTDWQSVFYGPTFNMTHNVSALGGDQKFNYKVNGSYYKENGIIANTGFARYALSMNTEYMPTTRFRLFTAVAANLGDQKKGSGNGVVQSGVAGAASASSLLPPPSLFSGNNVAQGAFDTRNDNKTANLRTNVDLRFELFPGLNISNAFSYEYTGGREDNFRPAITNNNLTELYAYDDRRDRLYNRATISYTKAFHDEDHLINAYLFNELTATDFMAKALRKEGTPNDQYEGPLGSDASYLAKGGVLNNYSKGRMAGFAGTVSYNYKRRYVLDFSYRIDGTSTNGPDMPYVKNPAIGARWNFDKEKFMENFSWLSYGSLRASWGKNIVPSGSIFDANGKYSFSGKFNNTPTIGLDWKYLPNTELIPMVSTQYSIAAEMGFLDGKITTILETYYKQVDNQLMEKTIADHNAFEKVKTNEISLVNYGYEFTLGYRPFAANSKVKWTISANGAINHDILASLPDGARQLMVYDADNKQHILYRLGRNSLSNVLFHTRGVFSTDGDVPIDPASGLPYRIVSGDATTYFQGGDPYWTDVDGNYVLDDRDLVVAGNSFPRFTGGLQSFVQYNGFSLNMNISYTAGRDILNNALAQRLQSYGDPFAYRKDADLVPIADLDYWQKPGDVAYYPYPNDYLRNSQYSPFRFNQTLFQEDGSYLKLNTVTLSYNIPRAFTQRYGISSLRVYTTANNVYTFSKYSGPDPENVSDLGRDRSDGYPMRRSYTLGLNVQF